MAGRIVLFGGTFDPVHNGHLIVARAVAERYGFERITLMPAAAAPHKGRVFASGEDRLAMLRLAIAGEELFEVSGMELSRPGPSYTIDTVAALREQAGMDAEVIIVIGADMLEDLPNWRRVGDLLERARVLTAVRPPWDIRIDGILAKLAERLGEEHTRRLGEGVTASPLLEISSTDIRDRVSQGRSIRFLVAEKVREFIKKKGLYSNNRVYNKKTKVQKK